MTKQARRFTSDGSQAVRLPAEFRFTDVDAVYVRRNDAGEVILLIGPPRPYASFVTARNALDAVPEDFLSAPERAQHSQRRDPLDGLS